MPGELQQANAELIARIIRLGLGTAGVGAAVRGGLGLRDMLTDRNQLIEVPPLDKGLDEHEPTYSGKPPKRVQVHKAPRPVAIPVREKAAGIGDHINSGIDQAGQFLSKMLPEGVLGGSSVQDPRNAPWVPAAMVAGVGGGLYGGYKLMDWLLDKRRKHELSQRLHAARETYRQALQEGLRGKAAASPDSAVSTPAERLGQVFDTLVEHCDQEKTGLHLPLVGDIPEQALGWALLAHLGIAGAAGGAVYNYVKKRNNVEVLRKALRERAQQRSAIRPEHLIAFAQPQAA